MTVEGIEDAVAQGGSLTSVMPPQHSEGSQVWVAREVEGREQSGGPKGDQLQQQREFEGEMNARRVIPTVALPVLFLEPSERCSESS